MCGSLCDSVDDLQDTADLELHVSQSANVVMLLSRGYFVSANCLREVAAAVEEEKPLILVHEADPARGGAGLDELCSELEDTSLRNTIFADGRSVIQWYRLVEFQLQSLLLIVEKMLRVCSPMTPRAPHRDLSALPKPYIPGSILDKRLVFPRPVVLCECTAHHMAGLMLLPSPTGAC